jgi:hypothetical protein
LALILLVIGELALVGALAAHDLAIAFPFATDYSVPHYTATILAGMLAMWGAYALAGRLRGRRLHVALAVSVVALFAGVFAYSLYHGIHPAPLVPDGFRGHLESATAFHEQLALPLLVTLGTIAAMFAAATAEARSPANV